MLCVFCRTYVVFCEATITETPATEAADDPTLIETAKKQLTGSWNHPGVDEELLTFDEWTSKRA